MEPTGLLIEAEGQHNGPSRLEFGLEQSLNCRPGITIIAHGIPDTR